LLSFRYPAAKDKRLNVHPVVAATAVGLTCLGLSLALDQPRWLFPGTVSFAAHLGMVTLARLRLANRTAPASLLLGVSIVAAWLIIMTGYAAIQAWSAEAVREAALSLPMIAFATIGFFTTQPGMDDCPFDTPRWVRQTLCAGAASVLAAILVSIR
jgi:hypothetical protein